MPCTTRRSTSASSSLAGTGVPETLMFGAVTRAVVAGTSAPPLRDGQQPARPQVERIADAVGHGDAAPLRGVAVVAGRDPVERVADLHLVGAVRLRRAGSRVLRAPVGVGL